MIHKNLEYTHPDKRDTNHIIHPLLYSHCANNRWQLGPKVVQDHHIVYLNTSYMSFGVVKRRVPNFNGLSENLLYAK